MCYFCVPKLEIQKVYLRPLYHVCARESQEICAPEANHSNLTGRRDCSITITFEFETYFTSMYPSRAVTCVYLRMILGYVTCIPE